MSFKNTSLLAFVICCIILTALSFTVKPWGKPGRQSFIVWDNSGYYMYLPGIFYDDLGKLNNQQYIIDTYHPCGNYLNQSGCSKGNTIIKYSCGMAIMYLPGFIAGHFAAKMLGFPVDGFSFPYQLAMNLYSLIVCFFGLWISRKIL